MGVATFRLLGPVEADTSEQLSFRSAELIGQRIRIVLDVRRDAAPA